MIIAHVILPKKKCALTLRKSRGCLKATAPQMILHFNSCFIPKESEFVELLETAATADRAMSFLLFSLGVPDECC